jgi:hypothetical protein
MAGRRKYFTVGQNLFWILIILLVCIVFFHFADKMFKSDRLAEDLVLNEIPSKIDTTSNIKPDTSRIANEDSINYSWKWQDFNDVNHNITFKVRKLDLKKAADNRTSSSWPSIYANLYSHDKLLLKGLIESMKSEIKQSNLNYMERIEYVCSSIQYIPYTLILTSDSDCPCVMPFGVFTANCKVQEDGRGCCNQVDPFGVYSPLEFACFKTADCDTRALLAYTLLKEMGFDVAVMISESRSHSVLGISLPNANNYSYGTNDRGKKYVLWELTSWAWRLDEIPVSGNDWKTVLE